MDKLLAIASITFKEAMRNRILYTIVFFAACLVGSSTVLEAVFIGEHWKIIVDVGLAALEFLGLAVTVFVGIGLVQTELEKKTIYFVLSKPVSRDQFILGKGLGLAATMFVLVSAMAAVFLLTCVGFGIPMGFMLVAAIGFIFLKLLVMIAITMFFASFSGSIMSGIFVLAMYVIGHISGDIRELGIMLKSQALGPVIDAVYLVIPNLNYFDFKEAAVYNLPVDGANLIRSAEIGGLYIFIYLLLACLVFRRREIK